MAYAGLQALLSFQSSKHGYLASLVQCADGLQALLEEVRCARAATPAVDLTATAVFAATMEERANESRFGTARHGEEAVVAVDGDQAHARSTYHWLSWTATEQEVRVCRDRCIGNGIGTCIDMGLFKDTYISVSLTYWCQGGDRERHRANGRA